MILMFKVIRSVVPTEWTNDNYRDPIVVNQLKKDFLSKCYLCEQTDFGNVNVEHFVPHLNQSEELRTDWKNLYYSCSHCNGIKGPRHQELLDCCDESHNVDYAIAYFVRNDGSVEVTGSMDMGTKELPELPRFGMRMELHQPYENLVYYGRGPFENYIDRYSGAFIGRYEDKVENQFYWYIRPQETGNKTDVRWLTLLDSGGLGVKITGLQPISFSALHFSPEDLDPGLTRKLQHTIDIVPQKNIFLHVDLKQRGLGGDNSWGMYPHNKYRLLDKKYVYSYMIELID